MNHIHFEDQSNFLKRHGNDLSVVGQLVAFQIELLNLSQANKIIKHTIIPHNWHITLSHPKQDFHGMHNQIQEIYR